MILSKWLYAFNIIISIIIKQTWWRGLPTMDGKTARGASSPAKPALHIPEPLSTTNGATSWSHIFLAFVYLVEKKTEHQLVTQ